MCNILKMADRKVKQSKIWDSGCYSVLLMPDFLTLVWGDSMHFAKFPSLQFSKFYSSPNLLHFKIFVSTGSYGPGNFKTTPTVLI